MSDVDFGDFSITPDVRPARQRGGGVQVGEIPAPLAKMLAEHVPSVIDEDDKWLTLTAKDEGKAKLISSYAAAWGAQQDPKVYIVRLPKNRDGSDPHIVRLRVRTDGDDVKKRGRSAK